MKKVIIPEDSADKIPLTGRWSSNIHDLFYLMLRHGDKFRYIIKIDREERLEDCSKDRLGFFFDDDGGLIARWLDADGELYGYITHWLIMENPAGEA